MANLVEIKSVEVGMELITITALAIEQILMADDLFDEALEVPEVTYEFSRKQKGNMVYLMKVCDSQKRCKGAKSFGEKLEKLEGAILTLADSFRVKS